MSNVMRRLRELREDYDLTQKDIANLLEISQQHYSKYETMEYELPLNHLIKLADYYKVSADYLIGSNSQNKSSELDYIYVTKDYSYGRLLSGVMSLDDKSRQAVVEYVELQKLRANKNKKQ